MGFLKNEADEHGLVSLFPGPSRRIIPHRCYADIDVNIPILIAEGDPRFLLIKHSQSSNCEMPGPRPAPLLAMPMFEHFQTILPCSPPVRFTFQRKVNRSKICRPFSTNIIAFSVRTPSEFKKI